MEYQNISLQLKIKTELRLSSCGSTMSSQVTEALHWWPERGMENINQKHNCSNTTLIVENAETEVPEMFRLMADGDSLFCACEI